VPANAQVAGALAPEARTKITPVVPPATAVTKLAPGVFKVTPVPGIAAATTVRFQNFGDYDRNKDGAYGPMEFAQALYFLATADPVAGNPKLPALDRFTHAGAPEQLAPSAGTALLNATSDEFQHVDVNHDWRITPAELVSATLM
jgi:hypothetical protein